MFTRCFPAGIRFLFDHSPYLAPPSLLPRRKPSSATPSIYLDRYFSQFAMTTERNPLRGQSGAASLPSGSIPRKFAPPPLRLSLKALIKLSIFGAVITERRAEAERRYRDALFYLNFHREWIPFVPETTGHLIPLCLSKSEDFARRYVARFSTRTSTRSLRTLHYPSIVPPESAFLPYRLLDDFSLRLVTSLRRLSRQYIVSILTLVYRQSPSFKSNVISRLRFFLVFFSLPIAILLLCDPFFFFFRFETSTFARYAFTPYEIIHEAKAREKIAGKWPIERESREPATRGRGRGGDDESSDRSVKGARCRCMSRVSLIRGGGAIFCRRPRANSSNLAINYSPYKMGCDRVYLSLPLPPLPLSLSYLSFLFSLVFFPLAAVRAHVSVSDDKESSPLPLERVSNNRRNARTYVFLTDDIL